MTIHDDAWWAESHRESVQSNREFARWKFKNTAPRVIVVSLVVVAFLYMVMREFDVIQQVFGTPYIIALTVGAVGVLYIRIKD